MKYGAADYLTKPFDPDDAVSVIEQAFERRRVASQRKPDAGKSIEARIALPGGRSLDGLCPFSACFVASDVLAVGGWGQVAMVRLPALAVEKRLADDHGIRTNGLVVAGEQVPGTTEPGLDLVGDEQHVVPTTDLRHAPHRTWNQ